MKKIIFLLLLISLGYNHCVAQENLDVFDIARKGTLEQIKKVVIENPKAINLINKDGFSPLILACIEGIMK